MLKQMPVNVEINKLTANYKIGDIVIRKDITDKTKRQYAEKYIFLGTSDSSTAKPVIVTKQVMGGKVEIGIFIRKPVEIVYSSDDENYVVELLFYSTELFEKDE